MDRKPLRLAVRTGLVMIGLLVLLLSSGCVGIYDNTSIFEIKGPSEGMSEIDLLQSYGTPSFATDVGQQKVYMYKIRDNKYIILFGLFDGADLVVTCENGKVIKVDRVERPKAFSLFQPWIWADTE